MPRRSRGRVRISLDDLRIALQSTRWELLSEAARQPGLPGTQLPKVASRDRSFRGRAPSAHAHAAKLVDIGVLDRKKTANRVTFRITAKGRLLHETIAGLGDDTARRFLDPPETALLALLARTDLRTIDVLVGDERQVELAAALSDRLRSLLDVRATLEVKPG